MITNYLSLLLSLAFIFSTQSSTYAKNNVVHYIDFEILNYSTELDSICDATTAVAPDNKCIRSFKICLTPLLASHKSSSSNNGQQQQLPTINRIGERVSRARFNYFTGTHQSTADVNPFYDERKKLHRRVNTGTFTSSSSSSFASPSSSSSFNVPPVQSIGGTSKSKSSTSSNIRPSVRSKINVTPYHIKYHSITSSASSSNWSALGTNVVTSSPNVSTVNTSTSTSSISNVNPSIVTTSTPVSLINDTIGDNKQSYLKSFFNKILGTIKAAQSLSSYVIPSSTAGTFSSSSTSLSNDSLDGNASVHNHYGNQCSLAHWFTPVSNASMSNVSSSSSSTSSFTSSSPVIVLRTKVPTALLASLSYLNNIGNKRYSSNNLASVITRSRARFNPTIQSVDPVKILINIEVWQENFAQLNSSSSSSSPSFDHNNNSENSSHHQVNNNYSSKSNKEKTLIGKIHDELSVSLSPDTFSTDGWIQGEFINNKNLTHFYSLNSTSSSNDSLLYSNSYDIHEIVTQIHGKLIALKYRWKITEEIIPLNKDSSSKSPDNSLISTVYGVPGEITAGQGDTQTSDFSSSSSSSHVSSVTTSPVSFTSETTTKVTCPDGYTGVECKDAICTPGCHVTHGYCDKANECKCKFGWTGELCERCKPMPGCVHGSCIKPFECRCEEGWTGMFCDKPTCKIGCHPQNGYCEQPGECRCRFGFKGENCSDCSTMPGCQRGTCEQPLDCNCEPGWRGIFCSIPLCSQGCDSDHGWCRRPEECRCRLGWTGDNCTECVPYPGCLHGTCSEPWTCNCSPGWGGVKCDEQLNTCETLQPCANGGTCVSIEKNDGGYTCHCDLGFSGENCTIASRSLRTF